MSNFFVIEQEIRERLLEKVTGIKGVYLTESLISIIEKVPAITPTIYLAYDNYEEPKNTNVQSPTIILPQRWIVILVTKNVANKLFATKDGKENSGVMLGDVLSALLNWKPPSSTRGLQILPAPKPMYSGEGVDYFSLSFLSHITIKSN